MSYAGKSLEKPPILPEGPAAQPEMRQKSPPARHFEH